MVFIRSRTHELRVESQAGKVAKGKRAAILPTTVLHGEFSQSVSELDLLEVVATQLVKLKATSAVLVWDLEPYHLVECPCCGVGLGRGGFRPKAEHCLQWQKLANKTSSFITNMQRDVASTVVCSKREASFALCCGTHNSLSGRELRAQAANCVPEAHMRPPAQPKDAPRKRARGVE
jgi:hypothetical protein